MAPKIQDMPRRRRATVAVAAPPTPPRPTYPEPPIAKGVDAVVAWVNQINLGVMTETAGSGDARNRHKALQALVSALGRCRGVARDVELLLRAREQREGIGAGAAYGDVAPQDDAMSWPLWSFNQLAALCKLVVDCDGLDAEDLQRVTDRLKHHVAGVTVRESGETASFKRRHRIGADVAGAVEGYAQVQQQLEKEALTQGDAEDARDDLIAFGHFMKGDFASPWHVQVVCDALMKAERREIKGLIINMPPRRGKSTCASELFPAWYLGRHPSHDIIVATHSQSFADSVGRKIRNAIAAPEYQRVFPGVHVATDSSAAAVFEIVVDGASSRQRRGNCKSFGRGGAPAGSGSNCFPAGTMISTEIGQIPIEKFCEGGYTPPRVLTYDHRRKQAIWGNVVASAKRRAAGLVELTTRRGRKVLATPEHLVYSGETWIQAQHLESGDPLLAEGGSRVPPLRRDAIENQRPTLQALLHEGGRDLLHSDLLCLQNGVSPRASGSREGLSKGFQVFLLQHDLHQQAQRDQADASATLQTVRSGVQEGEGLLLPSVRESSGLPAYISRLSDVREGVSTSLRPTTVLQSRVCVQSALTTDAGAGQFALQDGDELHRLVSEDATADHAARRTQVRFMPEIGDLATSDNSWDSYGKVGDCHTSYRRGPSAESSRESDRTVRGMPHLPPQSTEDTVAMVRRYSDDEVEVYDLQVAEHSCFFAGEILVHNCLLIDDFLSELDAYSPTERGHLLDDLLAFRTRLAPDAIWIVINTRYHEDDVVGVVKRDFADDREWTVITLPEFAEVNEEWTITTPATRRRKAERRVFKRSVGDVLWPERFSAESSEQLKSALLKAAPQKWWGQFMCRPVPASGALIDVSWFRRYDYADVMDIVARSVRTVVSVDTGGTRLREMKSSAARTAITVWAELDDGRCYLLDVLAEPWIYPDILKNIKEVCSEWKPTDLLIEEKAAGVEVVVDLYEQRDWVRTPITPIMPVGPKETRMAVATPWIRSGMVYVPAQGPCADVAGPRCPAPSWLEEYLNEAMHFPLSTHKDRIDATSQFLNWRRENPVFSNYSDVSASSPEKDRLMRALSGQWGQRGGGQVKAKVAVGRPRR